MFVYVINHVDLVKPPARSIAAEFIEWLEYPSIVVRMFEELSNECTVAVSQNAYSDYNDMAMFPTLEYFKRVIEDAGLQAVFPPQELNFVFEHIMQRASVLEAFVKEEVLGQTDYNYSFYGSDEFEIVKNILFKIYVLRLRGFANPEYTVLMTPHVAEAQRCDVSLEIEYSDAEDVEKGAHNFTLNVVKEVGDIENIIRPVRAWKYARDSDEARSAVSIEAKRQLNSLGTRESPRKFSFSEEFLVTAEHWGCAGFGAQSRTAFNALVGVVCDDPRYAYHYLYHDETKREVVEDEDFGFAVRLHLTKRGAGLRLMFWCDGSGEFRFANVGPKNELRISRS